MGHSGNRVSGRVCCEVVAGKTRPVVVEATYPIKFLTTEGDGSQGTCWVYALSFGGGLVSGDAAEVDLEVKANGRAVFLTQASTKVYRVRAQGSITETSQNLLCRVGTDAILAYVPDPVVCFATARYRQRQRFDLAATGSLVYVESITSGRMANAERWEFGLYSSQVEVHVNGRPVWRDGTELCPAGDAPGRSAQPGVATRMAGFNTLSTVLLIGPAVAPLGRECLAAVSAMEIRPARNAAEAARAAAATPAVLAASRVVGTEDAVVVRIASRATMQLDAVLKETLAGLTELLGEHPWDRKL